MEPCIAHQVADVLVLLPNVVSTTTALICTLFEGKQTSKLALKAEH
jgi:hypothetical protein